MTAMATIVEYTNRVGVASYYVVVVNDDNETWWKVANHLVGWRDVVPGIVFSVRVPMRLFLSIREVSFR